MPVPWCASTTPSASQRASYCDWNVFAALNTTFDASSPRAMDAIVGCKQSTIGEVARFGGGGSGNGSSSINYDANTQYNVVNSL